MSQDVSEALLYLNTVLGGFEYFKDPPTVTFRAQGAKNAEDRKPIGVEQKNKLDTYMKQFDFND